MADETEIFRNHVIQHAQLFDDTRMTFMVERAVEDSWQVGDTPPAASFVTYDMTTGQWTWIEAPASNGDFTSDNGVTPEGARESLVISNERNVARFRFAGGDGGDGGDGIDHQLTYDDIIRVGAVRFIGEHYYLCGGQQTVARRIGPTDWERLHFKQGGRRPREREAWRAIDGFAAHDIYVTGDDIGQGAIFHFDGTEWRAMDLPAGIERFKGRAICCAPDGMVYAVSMDGILLAGNAEIGWEILISADDANIKEVPGASAIAWFRDRLYVTSRHWLHTPEDGKWKPVTAEAGFQPLSYGGLSTSGSVMLVYGEFGAVLYDGEIWNRIYAPYSIDDVVRAEGLQKQVDALTEGVEIIKDIQQRRR